jgi:hypothetical protein
LLVVGEGVTVTVVVLGVVVVVVFGGGGGGSRWWLCFSVVDCPVVKQCVYHING